MHRNHNGSDLENRYGPYQAEDGQSPQESGETLPQQDSSEAETEASTKGEGNSSPKEDGTDKSQEVEQEAPTGDAASAGDLPTPVDQKQEEKWVRLQADENGGDPQQDTDGEGSASNTGGDFQTAGNEREEGEQGGEDGERSRHPTDDGADDAPSVAEQDKGAPPLATADHLEETKLEREKYDAQIKVEVKAREELEDMLLRMERHFKSEQAARKQAEDMLEQAVQAEISAKNQLEDGMRKQAEEKKRVEEEHEAIHMERKALETMRQEFENEIQVARTEVQKAEEALKTAEDRVRADERVEMARMETEYRTRIMALGSELERVREELAIRTQSLGEELERWRLQAELTAVAVIEAKSELVERRREIDVTKDRMDRLVDKLYMGREHGMVLHGAIQAAQLYHAQEQHLMLSSMQKSYYNGVQAALPWGGHIEAPSSKQLPGPALEAAEQVGGRLGKGKAGGKAGRAPAVRLPPLSDASPQVGAARGAAQDKRQVKAPRQRSKDR